MTISYKWLSEYLPQTIAPEKLSRILTSIGLEVESLEKYESVKGGLKGIVIGEVLTCEQHPNADKLKCTTVNIGTEVLKIVCGAPNVAVGQKVVVATVGATIYPSSGEPMTMRVAKIRGEESFGMLCAEDELGMGESHAGIMLLPTDVPVGIPAADYFSIYEDWIFEIGLTPNRMDAMSHFGVAKDVCAYLVRHESKDSKPKTPFKNGFKVDHTQLPIAVEIENELACPRYAGVTISGVKVAPSPQWLQDRLKAIGQKPINNVVDITNFVLHETGQPLHAFDVEAIKGGKIIVKNLPQDTRFVTLDAKERHLQKDDLLICNEEEPMCIAGVFGGLHSGVTDSTKSIFLESAYFHPTSIRKTSMYHALRTEAAIRFEKQVDISNVVNVLKRAALLIKEICGGEIASDIVDVYPNPVSKKEVGLKYHYLKKISGKNYHQETIENVLEALGFEKLKDSVDEIRFAVPFSKPDITLPADLVEELLRIDGLDNIDIPTSIKITPQVDDYVIKEDVREKLATALVGLGFNEIMTNSITNSKYYTEEQLQSAVKMLNSLSSELDIMRPSMLETGLEVVAYNVNRKNTNLQLFEFGKTYASKETGIYWEKEHLALYFTGKEQEDTWLAKAQPQSFYRAKGVVEALLRLCGFEQYQATLLTEEEGVQYIYNKKKLAKVIAVSAEKLEQFAVKSAIFFADIDFDALIALKKEQTVLYKEVSKFPAVQRDLAVVLESSVPYEAIHKVIKQTNMPLLKELRVFDVFENEKLGKNKKSIAINFTFLDEQKTLTDKEIDAMMEKLMKKLEKELDAEIRK